MSYLEQAKKPAAQAPVITIVGFPGSGKTTLAALFPKPIFIQAEPVESSFDTWDEDAKPVVMQQLPRADKQRKTETKSVLLAQLRELATEDHDFKTVVIDSVTSLNELFEVEVVAYDANEAKSIGEASGGFNKGYQTSALMHSEIRRACEHLRKKGIAVVFIAHAGIKKLKNRPDAGEYTAYTIDMPDLSRNFYVSHSDAVLYLKSREFITGTESNKKGQVMKYGRITNTGERVLITSSDGTVGYIDAKNRYGMPQELEVPQGENPILQFIPFFNQQ